MLKNLTIDKKADTPLIVLNTEGDLLIKGRSLPENAERFYQPAIEWIEEYVKSQSISNTVLTIELEYFNSSSVKQILAMLMELENLLDTEYEVKVNWLYNEDDDLMEMKGREMASMVDIPFHLESFSV